jgi:hypothetical protein
MRPCRSGPGGRLKGAIILIGILIAAFFLTVVRSFALRQKGPPSNSKKGEHHQLLTDDVGHLTLAQQLHAVTAL